jgi:putative endopeptidase
MQLNHKFSEDFSPENNFYMWVNNDWIKNNPIPDNQMRWGSFNKLDLDNKHKIKDILEKTDNNKLKILYKQGLDIENRKNTINEVKKLLEPLQKSNTIEELLKIVVDYQISFGLSSPINFIVNNDFENSNFNILHLIAGGLGLPDRDYYLSKLYEKEKIEYLSFIEKYTNFFNLNLNIKNIYNLEESFAKYSYNNVQKRSPQIQNNPRTLEKIIEEYPNFKFIKNFFEKLNIIPSKINLNNPNFFKNLDTQLSTIDLQTWKDYFIYKFLILIHSFLSEEVEIIYFNFYSKFLSGIKDMHPIWERSLTNTQNQFGFLIGKKFIDVHFSEKAKKIALNLVIYIKKYLNEKIKILDWMSNPTKLKALEKLEKMEIKVGYPDKWREYKSDIRSEFSYLKNNLFCNLDDHQYMYDKLYKPIDKTEWEMFPQEVNAYYNPSTNEIVFPAGILQPPFFSENYDMAMNFGGIGCIIGHEITHGFDDQCCKFDANGDLKNWWIESDYENYKKKTDLIKNQFNAYSINGMKLNGELTLGENIADLGGLSISYESMKNYLLENPSENIIYNSFTPNQRFFINYAIIWRSNYRDEEIKKRLLTDPHSPPIFRVNGILKNIDEFYKSFNIKENSENRLKIW